MPGWGSFLPRNSNGNTNSGTNSHNASTSESGGSGSASTGTHSGAGTHDNFGDAAAYTPLTAVVQGTNYLAPSASATASASASAGSDRAISTSGSGAYNRQASPFEPHTRTSTIQPNPARAQHQPYHDGRADGSRSRASYVPSHGQTSASGRRPHGPGEAARLQAAAAAHASGRASGQRVISGLPADTATPHSPSFPPGSASGMPRPSTSRDPSPFAPATGIGLPDGRHPDHAQWQYRHPSYSSSSSATSFSQAASSANNTHDPLRSTFLDQRPPATPHEHLQDFLVNAVYDAQARHNSDVKKRTIQRVYQTLLQDAEWHRFLLPVGGTDRMPKPTDDEGWVWRNEYGGEQSLSLSAVQKAMDLELVKEGRQPIRKQREGKLCGKTLKRYERTYTCKTCAKDLSCVQCVDCFNAAEHEGHEVLFSQSFAFSASCDCGDPSAWKEGCNTGCAHHPPLAPGVMPGSRPSTHISDEVIPRTLISALYRTIEILLDFITTVMQWAPIASEYATLPTTEYDMRSPEPVTGVPRQARGQGPWSVVVWADEKHTAKEVTRQIRDATGVEWEVAEQYAKDIEERGRLIILTTSDAVTAFHAASVLQQIDIAAFLRPAHDAFQEEVANTCISILADLAKCHVGGDPEVILRLIDRAMNEPRGNMGLEDGTGAPVDLLPLAMGNMPRLDWFLLEDVRLWRKPKWAMRELYCGLYSLDWEAQRSLAVRFAKHYPRLFEIFLFHDRDADSGLLFCISYMILGNGRATAYATQHAGLFWTMLDVAHAWFTGQVLENKLVIPPLDIAHTSTSQESLIRPESIPAFKGKKGIALFGQLRSLLSHEEIQRMMASDAKMFRRAAQFLNVFVGIQTQIKELDSHVEFEVDWPRTFVYLGDLSKCARDIGESLKYIGSMIAHPTTGIVSPNPAPIDKMNYTKSMIELAMRVYRDICLDSNVLDKTLYSRMGYNNHTNILLPGSTTRTLCIDTAYMQAFSFHSYIDLLFAEALRHVDVLGWRGKTINDVDGKASYVTVCDAPIYGETGEELLEVSFKDFMDEVVLDGTQPETKDLSKLILMEVPLQKHAILAHIRADLWRKNGGCMRGQAHHYRDATVRDATLDQEFFALQAGLCALEPLQFFAAVIDRFGVQDLFSRDVRREQNWGHDLIEPKQYVQLLEDVLMLCIHLATDLSVINKHSQDTITRRHIVQYLGLQNMTYSELLKKLPEKSIAMSLVPILREIADFREPTETVQGQYSLKPEYIKDVDPYWHHYSRNEQRKAIDRILEQRKKDKNEDEVIRPLPLEHPDRNGPWYNVLHWLGTPVAYELIHYAMAHCGTIANTETFPGQRFICEDDKTPTFDLVLDLALHLCMLALDYDARPFSVASFHRNTISGALSTFQQLWKMQMTEVYKPWWPRIAVIIDAIAANVPAEYMADYRQERANAAAAEAAKAPKPDARQAAANRQKAIMANFAKQQKDFAAALDFDDDDDEDDDMDEVKEEQEEVYGQCIVCQEDVSPSNTGGLLALMQPCRVMRDAVSERDWFEESLLTPASLDQATRYHRFGMGTTGEPTNTDAYPARSHRFGAYISGCSHLMHEHCMANYFDATRYRHTQQVQRHHPENAVRSEYLCPLCKSLGNMLVPLDKPLVQLRSHFNKEGKVPTLREKMRDVSSEGLLRVRDSSKIWDHHVDTGELMPWFSDCIFHAASGKDQPYRREMRLSARMIERYRQLVRPLSDQSQMIRQKKAHMYIPNDIVNYTISAVEVSYRGLAMPAGALSVAEQVSESTTRLISRLIGSLQLELDLFFGKKYDRTALRVGIFARLLPDWYRASTLPTPLVCRNPLTLVIETAAIAPDLLHSVIHMGFFAEITRLMLGSCMWIKRCLGGRARPSARSSPPADPHLAQALAAWRGIKQIVLSSLRQNAGPFTEAEPTLALISDDELAKIMYSHTLPYLRRCAIIFYACTGRYPAPDALDDIPEGVSGTCEYTRLLKLLALPNPVEVLSAQTSTEGPMVGRWLCQWAGQGRMIPNLEYPGVYELARLPRKWEDVVIKYTDTRCDVCGTVPANPALCLLCGRFVCMAGDCCADGEQGECNAHMRECGGAVGIFVDIRRWLILYLYAGSGSFATMPYLDAHGELDINMRRNHRQYMHMGRMEELRRQTWLQHMIPHMTARKLELTSDGGGWVSL